MPPRSRTGSGPACRPDHCRRRRGEHRRCSRRRARPRPASGTASSPSTTRRGHGPLARASASLYDIVFYIAVVIFFLVEGLIVWSAFRYRRKATDTELPPQTHGNNLVEVIWTIDPDDHRRRSCSCSPGRRSTRSRRRSPRRPRAGRRGAVPVVVRVPRRRGGRATVLFTQPLPVGEDGGLVLPVGEPMHHRPPPEDVIHAFYVPKFLFKRDVVPGKTNTFDFTVEDAGDLPRPVRRAVRRLPRVDAVRRPCRPRGRLRHVARGPDRRGERHAAARAVGRGRRAHRRARAAKDTAFTARRADRRRRGPFTIHFKNDDASIPHNVEIKDASGAIVFKGDLFTGPGEIRLRGPAAHRRHLHLCLHGPPEHDRHAHGPVREHAGMATTTLDPAAPAYGAGARSTTG